MDLLANDMKLKAYLGLIKDSQKYPVFMDSKNRVMSVPPIINSDFTKIKLTTRNILIEATATDLNKAN